MKAVTLNELCSDCTRIIASRVFLELMCKLNCYLFFGQKNLNRQRQTNVFLWENCYLISHGNFSFSFYS
jgi:hypothetical protein